MKIYVCGPMSGIKGFNVAAFDAAAARLRALGHEVVSPAELDGPETRARIAASPTGSHKDLPPGETYGFYLSRDVRIIADEGIEALYALPGWEKSTGTALETFTGARLCGLPVHRYDPDMPYCDGGRVSGFDLVCVWADGLAELR